MNPTVSVVIPAYNRAELLGLAIESVLAQTRLPEEIIVIDDCSTDSTPEVLAAYDDRVRSHRCERNLERGAARNIGIELARGELIAFLDCDDEWEPQKLARQLDTYRPGHASVTGARIIDADGVPTGECLTPNLQRPNDLFVANCLPGAASSLLVERTAVLSNGGFPTSRVVQGSEDWLFLIALAAHEHRFDVVAEPLLRYRVHSNSSTQDADNLARSMWQACDLIDRRAWAPRSTGPARRSSTAGAIAASYVGEGRLREAGPWLRRAVREGTAATRSMALARCSRTAVRIACGGRAS